MDFPEDEIVNPDEAASLPPDRVLALCTGSQGEPLSALTRIAYGDHPTLSVEHGDTVIISAKPVPGNELRVHDSINQLARSGAEVLHEEIAPVHVSGHAYQEELRTMLSLLRPRYVMPIHGEYRMLAAHAKLARDAGVPDERIVLAENGSVVELGARRRAPRRPRRRGRDLRRRAARRRRPRRRPPRPQAAVGGRCPHRRHYVDVVGRRGDGAAGADRAGLRRLGGPPGRAPRRGGASRARALRPSMRRRSSSCRSTSTTRSARSSTTARGAGRWSSRGDRGLAMRAGWDAVIEDHAASESSAARLVAQLQACEVAALAFCRLLERWRRGEALPATPGGREAALRRASRPRRDGSGGARTAALPLPARAGAGAGRGTLVVRGAGRRRARRMAARARPRRRARLPESRRVRLPRAGGPRARFGGARDRGELRRCARPLVALGRALRPPRHAARVDGRRPPSTRRVDA